MTSMREHGEDDREDQKIDIDLLELMLVRSRKTYDLYRIACRLTQSGDVLDLVLDVKDDCVYVGEVAPLIKHCLNVAFAQLADATFSTLVDDSDEQPIVKQSRWSFDLQSLRREPSRNTFVVDFKFCGPNKASGCLTVGSSRLDDPWCAVPIARSYAHDIFCRACAQTQTWKLNYEELEEL